MIVKATYSNIKRAASLLKKGGVIALPTETFYALCTNALLKNSIKRVVRIKGRSSLKGISVFFRSRSQLVKYVEKPCPLTKDLMDRFWPGPLSLIFNNSGLPKILEGNKRSISARISPGKVLRLILKHTSFPVTATSANKSGGKNPRTAAYVLKNLGDEIDLILDGGTLRSRTPSTIVDSRDGRAKILRRGKIPEKMLKTTAK